MNHQRRHTRHIRKSGVTFEAGQGVENKDLAKEFSAVAREVWGPIIDKITLHARVGSDRPHMAALVSKGGHGGRRLIGTHLCRAKREYTLEVKLEFMSLTPEQRRKIMVHEAVHIGCGTHNSTFQKICTDHGGAVCMNALNKDVEYAIQTKPKEGRTRFKDLKVFSVRGEAMAYGKSYSNEHRNLRVRIQTR